MLEMLYLRISFNFDRKYFAVFFFAFTLDVLSQIFVPVLLSFPGHFSA